MKASDIYAPAAEMYREEVSGNGVPVSIPEIGLDFKVFPQQPMEGGYMGSASDAEFNDMRLLAIRYIAARAKNDSGNSIFDDTKERDKWKASMSDKSPSAFDVDVAIRVIDEITSAFKVPSIEEAGNESEDVQSSDSTSTLPKNVDVPLTP